MSHHDKRSIVGQKITPFLWYQDRAGEAAKFYVSVFSGAGEKAKIMQITRYPKATEKVSGKKAGSIMTVEFMLAGQQFVAINGGEPFKLSEATSFVINCKSQKEIDYYWKKLTAGGNKKAQICGWLKDKYGLSWQVVPIVLAQMLQDKDIKKAERVMKVFLPMKKIIIADLKRAYVNL